MPRKRVYPAGHPVIKLRGVYSHEVAEILAAAVKPLFPDKQLFWQKDLSPLHLADPDTGLYVHGEASELLGVEIPIPAGMKRPEIQKIISELVKDLRKAKIGNFALNIYKVHEFEG